MADKIEPPTLQEFIQTVRDAFAFLQQFGFSEVSPPPHRKELFQVWFRANERYVIIKGEGYGTMASVTLEHENGLELGEIDLVPAEERSPARRKSRTMQDRRVVMESKRPTRIKSAICARSFTVMDGDSI